MVKSVQSVERACDLLFLIASSESGLGVSELACKLGLAKSATHRILVALSKKPVVQQDPLSRRYNLHPKVLQLILPFQRNDHLIAIAWPYLDDLRDCFQETTVLTRRDSFYFMTVAYSPSPFEFRFCPTVGRRMPLHWGAFGKAILAHLSAADFFTFLQEVPLESSTLHTIVDPNLLREELNQIRTRGFSQSIGEVIEGTVGLAAPIFDSQGQPIGCIGLGGPEVRLKQFDLDEIGAKIKEAANHITLTLIVQSQWRPSASEYQG